MSCLIRPSNVRVYQFRHLGKVWYRGRDLNPHDLAATCPSNWRVCHFRHERVEPSLGVEPSWQPILRRSSTPGVKGMVPTAGVAPARPRGHWCLRPARLLFRHMGMRRSAENRTRFLSLRGSRVTNYASLPCAPNFDSWVPLSVTRESNPVAQGRRVYSALLHRGACDG